MLFRHRTGFTLLELLVVMLLLSLTVGMVVPQAGRWLTSAQQRGWRADLKSRIAGLPIRAFLGGTDMTVDVDQLIQGIPTPPGVVRLPVPLRYGSNGMAFGGKLELVQGSAVEVWSVAPVTGEVVEEVLLDRAAP